MPKPEIISEDHPISRIANSLFNNAEAICAENQISLMDFCFALSNTCRLILANSKDMPRKNAIIRMNDLRTVMQGAYDCFDVQGEG